MRSLLGGALPPAVIMSSARWLSQPVLVTFLSARPSCIFFVATVARTRAGKSTLSRRDGLLWLIGKLRILYDYIFRLM